LPLQLAQAKQRRAAPQAPVDTTPPDFGTTEGTARIAAAAGFIDVLGIKLGMPGEEATALLSKHDPTLVLTPLRLLTYKALPDVSMTPVIVASHPPKPGHGFERFSLELTYSPNASYVWGVSREVNFDVNELPTLENVEASFRKKYGPESFKYTNEQYIWIFDLKGDLVTGQNARTVFSKCSTIWMLSVHGISAGGNRPTHDNRLSNSYYDQQLRGGYYHGSYGRDHHAGTCHSHAILHVGLQPASGSGPGRGMARGFVMRASNRQLEASGVQAAHTLLAKAAGELERKHNAEASKRGGPKL
jgi:hypothetical protein